MLIHKGFRRYNLVSVVDQRDLDQLPEVILLFCNEGTLRHRTGQPRRNIMIVKTAPSSNPKYVFRK